MCTRPTNMETGVWFTTYNIGHGVMENRRLLNDARRTHLQCIGYDMKRSVGRSAMGPKLKHAIPAIRCNLLLIYDCECDKIWHRDTARTAVYCFYCRGATLGIICDMNNDVSRYQSSGRCFWLIDKWPRRISTLISHALSKLHSGTNFVSAMPRNMACQVVPF